MRVFFSLQLLLISWLTASLAQRPVPPEPAPGQAAPRPVDPNRVPEIDQQNPASDQVPGTEEQNLADEYNGPGVLSRGYSATRPTVLQAVRFQPFAGIRGIYDTGLTGLLLDSQGRVQNVASFGAEVVFGVSGRKIYRHDVLGVHYRGNIVHYTPKSFYDGSNHLLDLDWAHRATKHVTINLKGSAGMYSNNNALLNSVGLSDTSIAGTDYVVTPNTQAFDNRVIFASSQVDVVYKRSARLSFDLGGGGFLVRRRSSSLYGVTGAQARGDANYRVTKKTTIGVYYAFSHYDFTKAFGGSDVNTIGLNYAVALDRTLELRLRVGGSRVETLGLITVQVDPVIAAILGQSVGIQTIYRVNYVPDFSGQLTKTFKKGNAGVEYTRGVSPGNGLYLTSQRDSASVRAEYSGIRRYAVSIGGGRDSLTSLGVSLGNYTSYYVLGGVVRNLNKSIQGDTHLEYRHYSVGNNGQFSRDQVRISLGFTFSPSERPLSVW